MKRAIVILGFVANACSPAPEGLALSQPAHTTVKMDLFHEPLPEIALPNDLATRYDALSPTGRRINASMVAPTGFEKRTRELLDTLDGWGVFMPITIPFSGPIDPSSVAERHDDADYDIEDDAIYVVNIDRRSPKFGRVQHLDFGNGNYPAVLERRDLYWKNDPRGDTMALLYEEVAEDENHNGVLDEGEDANGNGTLDAGEDLDGDGALDPPEDSDADGILDVPNYLPGKHPAAGDVTARADALMTFYERATHTLIGRPLVPLDDGTRYAVVVTRRVLDVAGDPVGSPYPWINHLAQTQELEPLLDVLPASLAIGDIAFTYSFTTQSIRADWQAVRDGLHGVGIQRDWAKDHPAELRELLPLRDSAFFPDMKMPHLLHGEAFRPALQELMTALLGTEEGEELDAVLDGTSYVDWYAIGTFESPQLFPRNGADGLPLGLNDQVWPADLARRKAPARGELVHFTLSVPRKEISVRHDGKPAPLIVLGHGYGSSRFEVLQFSSYLARHGFAAIQIDGPSHGIDIDSGQQAIARALLSGYGVGIGVDALLSDRAFDQNNDGRKDSGADFWTSYLFHTRDMVRQYAVDLMQLVRMVKSFDGHSRWKLDVDGDGQNELAGDFDADGFVDISADSELYMFGGSLGGIMAMILGAVEPSIKAIAPVSGGGGYGELGVRSTQGGVYQAFILRVMGPLFVGTIGADGALLLETIVADLNDDATFTIGRVDGVKVWDTMIVQNLDNGTVRCGYVSEAGTVRAGAEANIGDRIEIRFYAGPQLDPRSEDCALLRDAAPYAVVDSFGELVSFQGESFAAGDPLVALQEGLGMRRGHPDFRRLAGLGQMVLDPSDPVVLARHLLREPLKYGTGEETGAHALIISTMGDSSVPVSGGVAVGRAAGLIGYLTVDSRYGVPANQLLIDTHTVEGVHNLNRYTDPAGNGVHLDLENFSQGDDLYGASIPRFDDPPRIGFKSTDRLGGKSAAIFPYNVPEGQHGFDLPGGMTDKARAQCLEACTEMPPDPCGCTTLKSFDIGYFMLNMIGFYFRSGGAILRADRCLALNDCAELAPPPAARDPQALP